MNGITTLDRLTSPFRSEGRILSAAAIIIIICGAALISVDVSPIRFSGYLQNAFLYLCVWVIFFSATLFRGILRQRPESPFGFIRTDIFNRDYRARLRRAVPMLIVLIIFMQMFSAMKSAIPLFNSFSWDDAFISLDQRMHGTDPWRLIQPLVGLPILTSGFALAYHLWILLIYVGGIYFGIYEKSERLKLRYFATYFSIWTVIGMVMATGFASVGPCFLEPILGNAHFSEQMAYLREVDARYPVMVLDVQDQLLAWHRSGSHGLGRGITAMPSMHIAMVTLYFLAFREKSRLAGWIAGAYALIIFIGSIHLGYHYAVDGYVSFFVTWLIWAITGRVFRDASLKRDMA